MSSFLLDTYIQYRQPIVHWKAKSYTQLTSSVQYNGDATLDTTVSVRRLFKPLPLKIYRREVVTRGSTETSSSCNPRVSMSIDELTRPGGYIVTSETPLVDENGLASTLDLKLPNDTTQLGTPSCNTKESCFSPAADARRRVRSAGMIKRKFNTDVSTYYTNTNQYLTARNETYARNMFNYQDQGIKTPGTKCTLNSTYKPSNERFMTQGGVSSGDVTTRRAYNAITKVGASFRTSFGNELANAMAYGVPNSGGTNIKEKIGYPNILSPPDCKKCPRTYNG